MWATDIERAVEAAYEGEPERTPEGFSGRFTLPPGFPGFRGHFPGAPICPAVVQLCAAEVLIGRATGRRLRMAGVESAKFLSPLGPNVPVEVRCAARETPRGVGYDVRLTAPSGVVSSFLLLVADDDGSRRPVP